MQRGARRRRGRCGRTALRCGFTSKSVSENDSHSQNPFPPQHTASGRDAGGCQNGVTLSRDRGRAMTTQETAQGAGVRELGHLVLYVADIGTSTAFYEDALGWRRLTSPPELGTLPIALFSSGRTHHELLLIEVGRSAAPVPQGRTSASTTSACGSAIPTTTCARSETASTPGGADRGRFGPWRDPQPLRARPRRQ